MTTLTIELPDDLAEEIKAEAAARNLSESEVVCRRVRDSRTAPLRPGDIDPRTGERILPFEFLISREETLAAGVPADLSLRIDEVLSAEWSDGQARSR